MKKANRIFKTTNEDGEELVYEFRRPTQQVISKGDLYRRQKYAEAMRAGALMNAEVVQLLKNRGVWGDSQEERSKEMRQEILSMEEALRDPALSNDDGVKLVEELRRKRADHMDFSAVVTNATDATCESMAQEELNMFYAAECTYNKSTGQKVYKDVEDFKSRLGEVATRTAYHEATIASFEDVLNQDLPSDLSSRWAENKWLSERGLLESDDDAEDAKDAEDTEGVADAPKPKRRRKKAASE